MTAAQKIENVRMAIRMLDLELANISVPLSGIVAQYAEAANLPAGQAAHAKIVHQRVLAFREALANFRDNTSLHAEIVALIDAPAPAETVNENSDRSHNQVA